MKMGFKMQIYPTKEQEQRLFEYCKASQDMWNFLVAKYKEKLPVVGKYGIKEYKPYQLIEEMGIVVPQRIAFDVIKRYATAVQRVYNKLSVRVKFHKFNPNKQSFCLTSAQNIVHNQKIRIPFFKGEKDLGSKEIFLDDVRIKDGEIKIIIEPRYTYQNGKWYLSGSYDVPDIVKNPIRKF